MKTKLQSTALLSILLLSNGGCMKLSAIARALKGGPAPTQSEEKGKVSLTSLGGLLRTSLLNVIDVHKVASDEYALLISKTSRNPLAADYILVVDSKGAAKGESAPQSIGGSNFRMGFSENTPSFPVITTVVTPEDETGVTLKISEVRNRSVQPVFDAVSAPLAEGDPLSTLWDGTKLHFGALHLNSDAAALSIYEATQATPRFNTVLDYSTFQYVTGPVLSSNSEGLVAFYSVTREVTGNAAESSNEVYLVRIPSAGGPAIAVKVSQTLAGVLSLQIARASDDNAVFIARDGAGVFARRVTFNPADSDPNYGVQGFAQLDGVLTLNGVAGTFEYHHGFIDDNGRIYACGTVARPGSKKTAVWRFTAAGVLDTTFNQNTGLLYADPAATSCARVKAVGSELILVTHDETENAEDFQFKVVKDVAL